MTILSNAEYERAAANGIGKDALQSRVYCMGWDVEEAITTPSMKKPPSLWREYEEIATVSKSTFLSRLRKGWEPELAATSPRQPRKGSKIFPEHIEFAKRNGISLGTLKARVNMYKWPIERAITEPIKKSRREPDWNITR